MGIKLFSQNDAPYGRSMRQWSNSWWNWMVGQPKDTNPTYDIDGKSANNCQTYDDVYFLCGTTTTKTVVRNCRIPDGKSILFPVICFERSLIEDPDIHNPRNLLALATEDLNVYNASKVSADINNDKFSVGNGIIRIRSPFFGITLPKNNVWNTEEDGFTIAAADGYWIFVSDLDPGTYKIRVSAVPSKSDNLNINTTYDILIGDKQ